MLTALLHIDLIIVVYLVPYIIILSGHHDVALFNDVASRRELTFTALLLVGRVNHLLN